MDSMLIIMMYYILLMPWKFVLFNLLQEILFLHALLMIIFIVVKYLSVSIPRPNEDIWLKYICIGFSLHTYSKC